jgi:hypothetical protein
LIREGDYKTLNWLEQVLSDACSGVNELTLARYCDEKLRANAFDDQTLKFVGQAFRQLNLLKERGDLNAEIKTALVLSSKLKNVDALESYHMLVAEYSNLGNLIKTLTVLHDRVLILEQMTSIMKRIVRLQRELCSNYFDRARCRLAAGF